MNYLNPTLEQYGSAIVVDKKIIITLLVIICIVTPGTNWIIPGLKKIIKTDLIWRYEK